MAQKILIRIVKKICWEKCMINESCNKRELHKKFPGKKIDNRNCLGQEIKTLIVVRKYQKSLIEKMANESLERKFSLLHGPQLSYTYCGQVSLGRNLTISAAI